MSESTRVEFELPTGYEDETGTLHKTVVMRKVKNSDIIDIQKDIELKAMASEKLELSVRNPIVAMRVSAQVAKMFSLLFTRVVLRIGAIEKPTKAIFLDMYQDDMAMMMEQYAVLNGVDLEQAKEAAENNPLV